MLGVLRRHLFALISLGKVKAKLVITLTNPTPSLPCHISYYIMVRPLTLLVSYRLLVVVLGVTFLQNVTKKENSFLLVKVAPLFRNI